MICLVPRQSSCQTCLQGVWVELEAKPPVRGGSGLSTEGLALGGVTQGAQAAANQLRGCPGHPTSWGWEHVGTARKVGRGPGKCFAGDGAVNRVRQTGLRRARRDGGVEECGGQSCQNKSLVRLRPSLCLCPQECPGRQEDVCVWVLTGADRSLLREHQTTRARGCEEGAGLRVHRFQSGQGEFVVDVRVAGLGGP